MQYAYYHVNRFDRICNMSIEEQEIISDEAILITKGENLNPEEVLDWSKDGKWYDRRNSTPDNIIILDEFPAWAQGFEWLTDDISIKYYSKGSLTEYLRETKPSTFEIRTATIKRGNQFIAISDVDILSTEEDPNAFYNIEILTNTEGSVVSYALARDNNDYNIVFNVLGDPERQEDIVVRYRICRTPYAVDYI